MRFKYDSYEKLYPRQEIQAPDQYETAVESFTPSKEEPEAPAAPAPASTPQPILEPIAPPITPQPEPIQEGNADGHADID